MSTTTLNWTNLALKIVSWFGANQEFYCEYEVIETMNMAHI